MTSVLMLLIFMLSYVIIALPLAISNTFMNWIEVARPSFECALLFHMQVSNTSCYGYLCNPGHPYDKHIDLASHISCGMLSQSSVILTYFLGQPHHTDKRSWVLMVASHAMFVCGLNVFVYTTQTTHILPGYTNHGRSYLNCLSLVLSW